MRSFCLTDFSTDAFNLLFSKMNWINSWRAEGIKGLRSSLRGWLPEGEKFMVWQAILSFFTVLPPQSHHHYSSVHPPLSGGLERTSLSPPNTSPRRFKPIWDSHSAHPTLMLPFLSPGWLILEPSARWSLESKFARRLCLNDPLCKNIKWNLRSAKKYFTWLECEDVVFRPGRRYFSVHHENYNRLI